MTIHEPMTMATDYLLALAALVFAARLWRGLRAWALAFFFTALAAIFGGTSHGFGPELLVLGQVILWKLTVFSVGLASFFLLSGAHPVLRVVGVLKLVVYASWMTTHDDFLWVIVDYGITLLLVGALELRQRGPGAKWVLGSIGVSVIAALVQASGFALHQHFNHNDLYHVIQIVALWLLFRGGREKGSLGA
jgi:hypothetical protein